MNAEFDLVARLYHPDILKRAYRRVTDLLEALRQLYTFTCEDSSAGMYGVLWEHVEKIYEDLESLCGQNAELKTGEEE